MLQTTPIKVAPNELIEGAYEGGLHWAENSFVGFRKTVRPQMIWGWWVERLALELEGFYERMKRGERPKTAIMAPPQHGKSWTATDFVANALGLTVPPMLLARADEVIE